MDKEVNAKGGKLLPTKKLVKKPPLTTVNKKKRTSSNVVEELQKKDKEDVSPKDVYGLKKSKSKKRGVSEVSNTKVSTKNKDKK